MRVQEPMRSGLIFWGLLSAVFAIGILVIYLVNGW